ncbi:hypothetical protein GGX14DRAFT_404847 [Mycena pura]|uniref:Uncharacterized protein n=1 Tax=Mycena pura TaxID=153505 RepID=A0AAD6UX80_9AGAR|nr:hypothetical protein GGX14DRAFT_404847 [Mycena pura]
MTSNRCRLGEKGGGGLGGKTRMRTGNCSQRAPQDQTDEEQRRAQTAVLCDVPLVYCEGKIGMRAGNCGQRAPTAEEGREWSSWQRPTQATSCVRAAKQLPRKGGVGSWYNVRVEPECERVITGNRHQLPRKGGNGAAGSAPHKRRALPRKGGVGSWYNVRVEPECERVIMGNRHQLPRKGGNGAAGSAPHKQRAVCALPNSCRARAGWAAGTNCRGRAGMEQLAAPHTSDELCARCQTAAEQGRGGRLVKCEGKVGTQAGNCGQRAPTIAEEERVKAERERVIAGKSKGRGGSASHCHGKGGAMARVIECSLPYRRKFKRAFPDSRSSSTRQVLKEVITWAPVAMTTTAASRIDPIEIVPGPGKLHQGVPRKKAGFRPQKPRVLEVKNPAADKGSDISRCDSGKNVTRSQKNRPLSDQDKIWPKIFRSDPQKPKKPDKV